MMRRLRQRPGTTFIELMLFLGFFAMCSGIIITVLIFSNEQRVRQQTITAVEQQGAQALSSITRRVRSAERILDPTISSSGSVLSVQISDEQLHPTIIAVQSGALVVAQHDSLITLTPSDVIVSNLRSVNTSASSSRPSVQISFTLTKQYPITVTGSYSRTFDTLVSLFPDDNVTGNTCECDAPSCIGGIYTWEVCDNDVCTPSTLQFSCE